MKKFLLAIVVCLSLMGCNEKSKQQEKPISNAHNAQVVREARDAKAVDNANFAKAADVHKKNQAAYDDAIKNPSKYDPIGEVVDIPKVYKCPDGKCPNTGKLPDKF